MLTGERHCYLVEPINLRRHAKTHSFAGIINVHLRYFEAIVLLNPSACRDMAAGFRYFTQSPGSKLDFLWLPSEQCT